MQCLESKGDYDDAASTLQTALELEPNSRVRFTSSLLLTYLLLLDAELSLRFTVLAYLNTSKPFYYKLHLCCQWSLTSIFDLLGLSPDFSFWLWLCCYLLLLEAAVIFAVKLCRYCSL